MTTGLDDAGRHNAEIQTPTGATYRSTAPPIAGGLRLYVREFAARIHVAISGHAA